MVVHHVHMNFLALYLPSIALRALLQLQLQQAGLGTADCLCIFPSLFVESITTIVQGIYLCLAFLLIE